MLVLIALVIATYFIAPLITGWIEGHVLMPLVAYSKRGVWTRDARFYEHYPQDMILHERRITQNRQLLERVAAARFIKAAAATSGVTGFRKRGMRPFRHDDDEAVPQLVKMS